jgi:hypothetical protein
MKIPVVAVQPTVEAAVLPFGVRLLVKFLVERMEVLVFLLMQVAPPVAGMTLLLIAMGECRRIHQ